MAACCKSSLLCLLIVLTATVSLPSHRQEGDQENKVRRHVSKVRLCGDQLVTMLRIWCGHSRRKNIINKEKNRYGNRKRKQKNTIKSGLGDRCCIAFLSLFGALTPSAESVTTWWITSLTGGMCQSLVKCVTILVKCVIILVKCVTILVKCVTILVKCVTTRRIMSLPAESCHYLLNHVTTCWIMSLPAETSHNLLKPYITQSVTSYQNLNLQTEYYL